MTDLLDRLKAALSDRYRIERELGSGGMATVYLAEDLKHHRKVAVKVLRPELAAALGSERFLREIEIAAALTHPHILTLIDSGETEGFLYYVMPYIEGESLRVKLAHEGELPVADAVRILRDVVDALAHAHRQGVVHRDVKPDNVLLLESHALVTDFGVAKAVSEATGREKLTTLGVALGTPTYMAPEQASADPHVDHRADIYAVGVMAYELLAGRPPFSAPTPQEVLSAHVTQMPQAVTTHRPSVPPALAGLVMRCLEKKPADRWQSTEELLPQLEALMTPSGGVTPTGTQPVVPAATEAAIRWMHPARVTGLFALAALGGLAIVYALVMLLGLPYWVVYGAAALLAIAFPLTLATGHHERRRTLARTTGTTGAAVASEAQGMGHWLTWRRAMLGGAVGSAVLAAVTVAYMAMRLLGIGPVGTLVAAGVLEEGETVVLAEFADHTGDSALAVTLTEAIRIDLSQSQTVRLMATSNLRDVLRRMERNPNEPLTSEIAREVAVREGIKAVVEGEINRAGGGYVLSTQLVVPESGDILVAFRETARDSTEIILALDRLSKRLREKIGESLRTVRASRGLARVTTASLPALRKYSQAARAVGAGEYRRGIGLLREAVAIDTTFARAYRYLAIQLSNLGVERRAEFEAMGKAFPARC
jgi:tRNA A-37 threonylcarbamoyl transferase component Bud32/TolB-like protein